MIMGRLALYVPSDDFNQLSTILFGSMYVFTAPVAMVGHKILKLCTAAVLFKELNTLEATISKTASASVICVEKQT